MPNAVTKLVLCGIILLSVAVRIPAAAQQGGGQDEDYFAVPGWTVVQSGVPRIPYVPSRVANGVFYRADEVLYALPPAYFYLEAVFFWLCGPSYAAARFTSLAAGVVALVFTAELGRRWYRRPAAGLWAAGLLSFSRFFFFPATTARPDMLCAACGLAAIFYLTVWRERSVESSLAKDRIQFAEIPAVLSSGAATGLALLAHPFALIVAIQCAAWILLSGGAIRRRLRSLAAWLFAAAAGFALWIPLIAIDPATFRIQFANNVLNRAGPGLLERFLNPVKPLTSQMKLAWEHAGALQIVVFAGGLALATGLERKRRGGPRLAICLAWSSVYFLAVCQGDHPSKGYWCYPASFLCLCVGGTLARLGRRGWLFGSLLMLLLLPGSGLRATYTYLQHWRDPEYSHPAMIKKLLGDLPLDGTYLVDVGCVLDFYLAGRDTTLALNIPPYFVVKGLQYDYLVVTRTGIRQRLPQVLAADELVATYGKADDDLAVYIEVWRKSRLGGPPRIP